MTFRHTNFGSAPFFQVSSNTGGLLSKVPNVVERAQNGIDIVGEIAGEEAVGKGQYLTGAGGYGSKAEGITIRYSCLLYTSDAADE